MKKLVLASTSPRRKELLGQVIELLPITEFSCVSPNIDETPFTDENAFQYVSRLALAKAKAGLELLHDDKQANCDQKYVVIGSDTIVKLDDKILGKPTDKSDAFKILSQLSGRVHQVITAVSIVSSESFGITSVETKVIETNVVFTRLTAEAINAYIATNEPMDKAGAYGIQGIGGSFVSEIQGSYSAVVGLPMVETTALIKQYL
ncbi:MAG: Maf family protein [Parashewanella sp.]